MTESYLLREQYKVNELFQKYIGGVIHVVVD
jgi:hypothetical protein